MELAEHLAAPAVPRQVYTGRHGPADDQALTTEAPSAPTAGDMYMLQGGEQGQAGFLGPRGAADTTGSLLSTIICDLPPQTVKITVYTTMTMIMNLATLLPEPRKLMGLDTADDDAADAAADDDEAPPMPTAELLHLGERAEAGRLPMDEDVAQGEDQEADQALEINPGGTIVKATAPLVPLPPLVSLPPLAPLPLQTIAPAVSAAAASLLPAAANVSACTSTMLGNLAKPCQALGALTVYTSTTTVYSPVDCGACPSLHVVQPKWGCPLMSAKAVVTADVASTWTTYICSGAATPAGISLAALPTLSLPIPLPSSLTLATPALSPLPLVTPVLSSVLSVVNPALSELGLATSVLSALSLATPALPSLSLATPALPSLSLATPALLSILTPALSSVAGIATDLADAAAAAAAAAATAATITV